MSDDDDEDARRSILERARDGFGSLRESVFPTGLAFGGAEDDDDDPDDDDEDDPDPDDGDDEDADSDEDSDDDEDRGGRLLADGGWEAADSPTSRTLHGVVHAADGPYACGEGGYFCDRDGDAWRTLLERGPGAAKNTLRAIDATDDGCRIWFAGDSGALGAFDVADGRLDDYSAPMEKTSTWEGLAVTGETGSERLRVANGSGEVLEVACEDGCPVWGDVVEPGGGSTVPAVTAGPDGFYAVDTSGGVYHQPAVTDEEDVDADVDAESETATGEWERIGVENAEVDFHDVWAGEDAVFVAGSDGLAYRYDPDCENWTPLHVGEGALQAIQAVGDEAVAAATDGRLYGRASSIRWEPLEAPTEKTLFDLAMARSKEDVDGGLATTSVDVAVGAGGTVLERDREF